MTVSEAAHWLPAGQSPGKPPSCTFIGHSTERETEAQGHLRSRMRLGVPVGFPPRPCQLRACCHPPSPAPSLTHEHLVLLTCSGPVSHRAPVWGSISYLPPTAALPQAQGESSGLCRCQCSHHASSRLLRSAFNPQIRRKPGKPQGSQDIVTLEIREARLSPGGV